MMLCLVCGDTASGVHYGVLSCEGCKGFFRRALQDKRAQLRRCNKNDNCRMSLKTRNNCQPCRLRRCLELGMAKEAARLGRRSRKTWKHLDFTIANYSLDAEQKEGSLQSIDSTPPPTLTPSSSSSTTGSNDAPIRYISLDGSTLGPVWQISHGNNNQHFNSKNGNNITRFFDQTSSPNGSETFALANIPSVETSISGDWNNCQTLEDDISRSTQAMDCTDNGLFLVWSPDNGEQISVSQSKNSQQPNRTCVEAPARPYQQSQYNPQQFLQNKTLINEPILVDQSSISLLDLEQAQLFNLLQSQTTVANSQRQEKLQLHQQQQQQPLAQTVYLEHMDAKDTNANILHLPSAFAPGTPIFILDSSKATTFHNPPTPTMLQPVPSPTTPSIKEVKLPTKSRSVNENGSNKIAHSFPDVGNLLSEILTTIEKSFCNVFHEHLISPHFGRSQEEIMADNKASLLYLFSSVKYQNGQSQAVPAFAVQSKCFAQFQLRIDGIMKDVIRFAKRIPGFRELIPEDKIVLVQSGCFELACILLGAYVEERSKTFHGPNRFVLSQSQLWLTFPMSKAFINKIFNFVFQMQHYKLEPLTMGLLLAVILVTPDRSGLRNPDTVKWLQNLISQAFQFQMIVFGFKSLSEYTQFITKTQSTVRQLSVEHRIELDKMKSRGFCFRSDLYSETFDLA